MKLFKKQAFTLVELIVVITILAILGTIAFISLQGYTREARDSKRLSDINNIQKKISIEIVKGTSLSSLISFVKTNSGLTIDGNNTASSIQGTANFQALKEDGGKFKDPITKGDYVLSYSVGGTGTGAYKFVQVSTINEENNQAVVKGNYYQMQSGDSIGIIKNNSNSFVINEGSDLPYLAVTGGGVVNIIATGGTITTYSTGGINYKVHTFSTVGSDTFSVTSGTGLVDYLVVGGGGGGYVGGGGGGGFRTGTGILVQNGDNINVSVGLGGAVANNGENSVFGSIISLGGGAGGTSGIAGGTGGSGGGGYHTGPGGSGTSGQGYNGGSGSPSGGSGGGGGGAGQAGANTGSPYICGKGGDGLPSDITGTITYYAGGASGYGNTGPGYKVGGLGGGGHGGGYAGTDFFMTDGESNTGGGGGYNRTGGSGIVIIRYQIF